MPEHIDLSSERPGDRADVHALTEKTGIKINISAGRIITGEACLKHEGTGDAPVAIGLAKFGRCAAACLPVGMLMVIGWLYPMPGWLLGILATVLFITVYAVEITLPKPRVKSHWPPMTRSNGHRPDDVPDGTGDDTKRQAKRRRSTAQKP